MTDLGLTIAPKSDQLNSDDLITGPRTIKIVKVSLCTEADQPIAINFEGDGGKPYKPCKSMRRVLVNVWGRNGNEYAGRSMTIYRDAAVQFGGMQVGGIRISHMSHIDKPATMALTATRANRKPFTVQPLAVARTRRDFLNDLNATLAACHTAEEVEVIAQSAEVEKAIANFKNGALTELNAMLAAALERVNSGMDDANEPADDDEEVLTGNVP